MVLLADMMTPKAWEQQDQSRFPGWGRLRLVWHVVHLSSSVAIPTYSFHSLFLFLAQYCLLLELLKQGIAQPSEAMRELAPWPQHAVSEHSEVC